MKTGMSSFDILAEVGELQEIIGARVNKVFQPTTTELRVALNVRGRGREHLVLEAGRRIHLTAYPRPAPPRPSMFAMALRKHLGNSRLEAIEQVGFDRIVVLSFARGEESSRLIVELFGKGNVVLTDGEYRILAVMVPRRYSTRELVVGAKYELPPARRNPFELSAEEIAEVVNASKRDLVRALALDLGLGGLYAEEVCLRAGVEKSREQLDQEEASRIKLALEELRTSLGKEKPEIVFREGVAVDVTPVPLRVYESLERRSFESFNQALDEYFTRHEVERVEKLREERFKAELGRLLHRLKSQTATIREYLKKERELRRMGDAIYQHFAQVEGILGTLRSARERYSWEEIEERIERGRGRVREAQLIRRLSPERAKVVLALDGMEVALDIRKSVAENAEHYYERSKKLRSKALNAREAVLRTVEEIRALKAKGVAAFEAEVEAPRRRVRRKREWYEKFRWFISSDGFLVLGGRDATSNEVLVKKHMGREDIFVHADIYGAPAVVIRTEGREVPESTIQEAFDFAASYSRAWKHGFANLEVYWVKPEQVSKRAESGEYVSRGAFVIRGRRNYGIGRVRIAIGVVLNDEVRIIGGPPSAIERQSSAHVVLVPGRRKSGEIAESVKRKLAEKLGGEAGKAVEGIPIEEIQAFLPPGTSDIVEERR
ncbi:MAG: fibronectin-binding domain-containing protein [Euryarchaeota archaeon]|nr:fibronectin-binding domain-containing protein [Euryarchaeota archaeon]